VMGMFINSLAMRNHPHGEKNYEALLKEVINRSIDAFENQEVQFEELVDRLNIKRDTSRNPLFDICMIVQNFNRPGNEPMASLTGNGPPTLDYDINTTKFDITFFIYEDGEGVYITVEYYTPLFRRSTVQRMAAHFRNIITAVSREPSRQLKDIQIISEAEKKQLLYEFNETEIPFPNEKT
ncbi:MAG: hypothetical protein GY940_38490, partial [bacterium]|nr:hypothetical protein [bacterium]